MTKEDIKDWERHPVTKMVQTTFHNRISALCTELGTVAGKDPLEDRFKAGYIAACRDILDVDLEESEQDD